MTDPERTEEATPRKLQRARERGEVPTSPLLGAVLALAGVAVALTAGGEAAIASFRRLVEATWSAPVAPEVALAAAADTAASILLWPLVAAVGLGALASFLQVGPLFTAAPLSPDLGRLDPARGLRRLASLEELAPRAGVLALALALLALAAIVLRDALPGLLGRTEGASFVLDAGARVLGAFGVRAIALLAVAAAAGVAYRRWRYLREQRMSRRELREERREAEGEPHARRRRAEAHRERALAPGAEEAVAGAAIVVRGSGRAVVLRWRAGSSDPPLVSLVARGALAGRVLSLAARARVASVIDEGLAAELERGRPLSRAALRRLARHIARGAVRGGG
ncbi:MAG: EscU/YscU/HrcU family type III secretion system export apparatus switch protein [Sandaracinaceae bacterium]|nr:EscU/YscU/HrcU family type III secretion system export apparatus switch protein [Sandaracinaceae bacterium]